MSLKERIDTERIPNHIAVIMDGNGRWAKKAGHKRIFGHKHGVKAVREVTEGAAELGVKYLTLYAFSTENWNRPQEEVIALMSLLVKTLSAEKSTLMDNNVQLNCIGDVNTLPDDVLKKLNDMIKLTSSNTGLTLTLALSYSSRWEILNAVKNIAHDIKNNKLAPEIITEGIFESYLNTQNMPDPDLLIRTSGEIRISNFLLWQIAYSELYFTDILWPDFRKGDLHEAILDYQNRERRFGKTSDQLTK